ncbi:MAG TPA: hypothetical protein VIM62_01570 [Acidobacteriaceae bacterium]
MGEQLAAMLANPIVAFTLRAALGLYVVWMARDFYADPLSYFRRWMPLLHELPWMKPVIRGMAAFCIWGGCFIVLAAIATMILNQHGVWVAVILVLLAAIAAYLLLPSPPRAVPGDHSRHDHMGQM